VPAGHHSWHTVQGCNRWAGQALCSCRDAMPSLASYSGRSVRGRSRGARRRLAAAACSPAPRG